MPHQLIVWLLASGIAFFQQYGVDWVQQVRNKPTVDIRTYNFPAQTPGGALSSGMSTSVTIVCYPGISGPDTHHSLRVSGGSGTAEAVLITGGTCTGNAASGTVVFTPANNHSGAWTITSATAGSQE